MMSMVVKWIRALNKNLMQPLICSCAQMVSSYTTWFFSFATVIKNLNIITGLFVAVLANKINYFLWFIELVYIL